MTMFQDSFPKPITPDFIHRIWSRRNKYGELIRFDTFYCDFCRYLGDIWFRTKHICRALREEIPQTELEFQDKKVSLRRLQASKWICHYYNKVTDLFYKKLHYRCIPESERQRRESEVL